MSFKFGDYVQALVGTTTANGFVIGLPTSSKGYDDLVVVANMEQGGAIIRASWCHKIGYPTLLITLSAQTLRERYLAKHPGTLKEEAV